MAATTARAPARALPAPTATHEPAPVAWRVSIALAVALAVAAGSLHVLFAGQTWWFVVAFVIVATIGSAAGTRFLTVKPFIPTLVAFVIFGVLLNLLFFPTQSFLGLIPTFETVGAFGGLLDSASDSIYRQSIPADADTSIVFALCVGIGLIAILSDLVAVSLRTPALVGIPLIVILAIPAITEPEISDGFFFALTAAAYLVLLLAGRPRRQPGLAVAIGAIAIVGALVVPAALPAITEVQASAPGLTQGVNPVLNLGDDLRRGTERTVLDYSTTSGTSHYLRLVALDDFTGDEWAPSDIEIDEANTVDAFAAPPGVAPDIASTVETTSVDVGNLSSPWLPLPYPPTSITGLDNDWFWEADSLSVSSPDDTARGQDYEVESQLLAPTPEQLLAAGTVVATPASRYTELPDDLPAVISDTATEVAGAQATNYERAIALQEYFRSDEFTYSELAPVEGDYDGTGMDVVATFLDVRAGYCVHFASAMAVMARSLEIPARVVVGFLPGTAQTSDDGSSFEVTTYDLHAWPELYFDGIGWVQFEPTPGRGELAQYADVTNAGVPTGPEPGASAPAATPTPSASAPAPSLPPEELDPGAAAEVTTRPATWPWVVAGIVALVLLSLLPALVRSTQRSRLTRRLAAGHGSAVAAWAEVLRTAVDLGLTVSTTETPRETARRLAVVGSPLASLLDAVEREQYGARATEVSLLRPLEHTLAALTSAASRRRQFAARFYPASVWRRIANPFRPEPRIDGPGSAPDPVPAVARTAVGTPDSATNPADQ